MLVERVSGTTLQAFCHKEFFEPLGIVSTQWRDDFRGIVQNRAIAYSKRGAKLYAGVFEMMQQRGSLNDGHPFGYGYGLFVQDFHALAEVSHAGATAGYRAWLGRIPAKGLSIAVLCNAGSANAPAFAYEVAGLYLGLPKTDRPGPPADFKSGLYRNVRDRSTMDLERTNDAPTLDGRPVEVSLRFEGDKMIIPNPTYGGDIWERVEPWTPDDLNAFAGTYTSDEAKTVLQVAVENGALVLDRRPDSKFRLKPTYTDAFKCDLGGVRFLRDASGKVVALSYGGSRVWNLRFARQQSSKAMLIK